MSVEIFVYVIMAVSIITSLVVEALKMIIKRTDYNVIAGFVSIILTIFAAAGYAIWYNVAIDAKYIIFFIGVAFASWLSAMLGFDKVKQAVIQIGGK